jgi:hypothetical protein
VHVDRLHRSELCEGAAGGEPRSEAVETAGQGDLQAVGEEGYEDVGFDASFAVMEDREDHEVALRPARQGIGRDRVSLSDDGRAWRRHLDERVQ